jgi:hypothetical protein
VAGTKNYQNYALKTVNYYRQKLKIQVYTDQKTTFEDENILQVDPQMQVNSYQNFK